MLVVLSLAARARAADALTINAMISLTGVGAFIGQAERTTLMIAERLINADGGIHGRLVKFGIYDDQSNPQVDVQLLPQILAGSAPLFFGPSLVAGCSAVAPLLQQGPVGYCLSPAYDPTAGTYVFGSSVSSSDTFAVIIRYFRLRGWTRIAVIAITDATGQATERSIVAAVKRPENRDVKLLALTHFNPTDVSVAAQVAQIAAAKPDAVIAAVSGTPVATVFKGFIEIGLTVPVASPASNVTYAQMNAYRDFLPKELYFPSGEWPHNGAGVTFAPAIENAKARFYGAFKAAGIEPDTGSTLAWDPILIATGALDHLGAGATADQVRTYIAGITDFAGIQGNYDFQKRPQRGLGEDDIVIIRWQPGLKTWEIVSQPTGIPVPQQP